MPAPLDLSSPASRRRFFIDRVVRRGSRGDGTLSELFRLPDKLHVGHGLDLLEALFAEHRVCLIGAHAASAYAPERATQDVDVFTVSSEYDAVVAHLRRDGFRKDGGLTFAQTALDLYGSRWVPHENGPPLDLISTTQPWGDEVFRARAEVTRSGDRVMPLAYLVLMKLDAARSIDQGDLSRMLGRLTETQIDEVVEVVRRWYGHDRSAIDDVRQYAEVGRWEYGTDASPT